jgi:hypothetical protein
MIRDERACKPFLRKSPFMLINASLAAIAHYLRLFDVVRKWFVQIGALKAESVVQVPGYRRQFIALEMLWC